MIKEIIHDPIFLAGKSEAATKEDLQVAQDLLDTLIANKDGCVGMAANMTGMGNAFAGPAGQNPVAGAQPTQPVQPAQPEQPAQPAADPNAGATPAAE